MAHFDFVLGSGGEGGPFNAFFYLLKNFVPVAPSGCPDIKKASGILGDDIGRIAAVGNDAVDAGIGPNGLPESTDMIISSHDCIQGVDPPIRRNGSMGRLPKKFDFELDPTEHFLTGPIEPTGVTHHRHVHIRKNASFGQKDFASSTLFGRGSDHGQATRNTI